MPSVIVSEPVNVGILGVSDIAGRKFIPAILKSKQARLKALASRMPEKLATFKKNTSVELKSYGELLADPVIDLVYISLPNHLHEEWSIRALEHGKHVLCEKPLALSVASAKRMLDAADFNGRLLFENIMYLQHPQHKAVKEFVLSGRIGRVLSLNSEFAFPGPVKGDFRLDSDMGGGAYNDLNRYPLSAALNFLESKKHRFIEGKKETSGGLNISLQAESVTDADEKFSFLTSFGLSYRSFYEITGELGSIRVERAYTTPADMENRIIMMVDCGDHSITVTPCDHFLATIEHVCELIRLGDWGYNNQNSLELAELAAMFQENCSER